MQGIGICWIDENNASIT